MRRFQISNRGCPKEIRSDNSPTFTETEKEIRPVSFRMGSRWVNIIWEMLIRNVSKTMKAILRVPNALTSLKIRHRVFAEVLTTLMALPSLQTATIQMTTIFYSEPLFASTTDHRDCSNTKILLFRACYFLSVFGKCRFSVFVCIYSVLSYFFLYIL